MGHIGSSQRTKYGAVGNPINLAGRIESYTVGGREILISEVTQAEVRELVQIKQKNLGRAKGVRQPIVLYDVIGINRELCPMLTRTERGAAPTSGEL